MAAPAVTSAVSPFRPTYQDLSYSTISLWDLEQFLTKMNLSLFQKSSLTKRQGQLEAKIASLTAQKNELEGDDLDELDQIDYELDCNESSLKTLVTMLSRQALEFTNDSSGAEHVRERILQSCDRNSFHAVFLLHVQMGFYEEAQKILARFAMQVPMGERLDPQPFDKMLKELLENVLALSDPKGICFKAVKLCEILERHNLDTPFSRMCRAASLVHLGSRYSLAAARAIVLGENTMPPRQPLGSGEVVQRAAAYADSKKGEYRPSLVILFNNLNLKICTNFPGVDIEGYVTKSQPGLSPRSSPPPAVTVDLPEGDSID